VDEREALIKAGEIARKVKEEVVDLIKPGTKLYDIAEFVERRIVAVGNRLFPATSRSTRWRHTTLHTKAMIPSSRKVTTSSSTSAFTLTAT